jgi:hypothetical protein
MAAPTSLQNVQKSLANSEPSTHGTKRTNQDVGYLSAFGVKADMHRGLASTVSVAFDPKRTSGGRLCCDAQNSRDRYAALC